jgi:hypothetical protein
MGKIAVLWFDSFRAHIPSLHSGLVRPAHIKHAARRDALRTPPAGSIPSGLTTITVERHQQLAVDLCGDRRQESNLQFIGPCVDET